MPRRCSALLVSLLALLLAACGSQLDPQTVSQVGGAGGSGAAAGGEVLADGSVPAGGAVPDGSVPDAAAGGADAGGAPAAGGAAPGAAGGGGDSSGKNGGSTDGGDGANSASGGVKGASCAGFKNGPGITDKTITIGNASDISGPVPGIFEASQDAVRAYVAYFNSTGDICGRKLAVKTYDTRADAAADQQAYAKACEETFAMVGSMSAFDSGGAATAQGCGLPDLRSAATTVERSACKTCFGAQSTNASQFQNAVADFVLKNYGDAGKHAGFLYINAGAAAQNAKGQVDAMTKRGMKFDVVQGIDITEFNYAPYVQQLKTKGVQTVFWIGAYQQSVRLRQAMDQQGYEPKLYLRDPTDYSPAFVKEGAGAVDGTVVFANFTPFEEVRSNKELALYLGWLDQVKPGATPGFFGLFSWSAARLFVERAIALGGKLDRASLVAGLSGVKNWTANDLHSPQQVGAKQTGECWRFIQLAGSTWKPVGGTKYQCSGLTRIG
ncbi:MAG TPA: ABC transporter substrate-binding protein [Nocardioides sp.]|uniref:ABC transporter substrate-binding protein n=1 Tax=Nocardioides sp. TaxID=35761 RepID=UPI002C9CD31D|nr:ABC transporter substrate-binding protein [Nocardioides sp.]HTW15429.1 ABC transporter substrate-binding protein [Nocardioides sp.]